MSRFRLLAVLTGLILLGQAASLAARWRGLPAPDAGADPVLLATVQEASSGSDPIAVIGDGQRIAYRLGRPALAVPASAFTSTRWDEDRLRKTMAQYGARVLVVSRTAEKSAAAPLVRKLGEGNPPAWLGLLAETPTARVYAVR